MTCQKEEVFVVGKMHLNGKHSPFIEIVLDTAEGRSDGEVMLFKEIEKTDNEYYTSKVGNRRAV